MKIRQGFVSNSSTSSFIAFGLKLSEKEIQDFIIKNVKEEDFEKQKREYEEGDEPYTYDQFSTQSKNKTGLDIVNPSNWEEPDVEHYGIYLGKDMGTLDSLDRSNISLDDLNKIKEKLLKYFPNKKAGFYGSIVYNG